ncbi:MAG: hypothetical protein PUP46_04350 [Endozoicomonas sp. (ex Botrylloides leachii)]|nr:hypothetical protein [Endozoicomonas sp. (ex Botrylloides leachii)]
MYRNYYLPPDNMGSKSFSIAISQKLKLDNSNIGDIGIYIDNLNKVIHSAIVSPEPPQVTHSVAEYGVYSSLPAPHRTIVFFRLKHRDIAAGAAKIAQQWSRGYREDYGYDFDTQTTQQVGYSAGPFPIYRGAKAFMGSSKFGPEAARRLAKYRGRKNSAPKYAICSEMVILAYQLMAPIAYQEKGFIMLDAKHSLPSTLARYLKNSPFWEVVARGNISQAVA